MGKDLEEAVEETEYPEMKKSNSLLEKVKETIDKYQMFAIKARIVVGVSGGPDSITLLHLLLQLRDEYELKLWIAHLNHQLRGKEAEEEAKWVRKFASKIGIPLISDSSDVATLAKRERLTLEEAGRMARYDFFERAVARVSANKIAVGHTASDQVETILMRLLKGAGLDGLSGIPPVRGKIIRPLIEILRKDVEEYCEGNGLKFCADSSNSDTSFLRNRVRLDLLPLLSQEYNPQISKILLQTSKNLREDADFIRRKGENEFGNVLRKEGKNKNQRWLVLDGEKLFHLHRALQKRVLREGIRRIKGNLKEISSGHLNSVLDLDGRRGTKQLSLPGNLVIQKQYGDFLIKRGESENVPFARYLVIPGKTDLPQLSLTLETRLISVKPHFFLASSFVDLEEKVVLNKVSGFPEGEVFLDFDKLNPPLFLRNRKEGDRFCPLGMKGSKKIKDFFIDLKIAVEKRGKIPLLLDRGRVVWIVGYRIDERFKVDNNTTRILAIKILKHFFEVEQSSGKDEESK